MLFVLMAGVFMISFVFLGVGSGSTGISQVLQNFFTGSSASGSSLSSLQKQTVEHPKDAAAWLAYANKLQADNQLDEAATALTTYLTLKPKDADAAARARVDLLSPRLRLGHGLRRPEQLRPGADAEPWRPAKTTSKLGSALDGDHEPARDGRLVASSDTSSSNAYEQFSSDLTQRLDTYKKLAKLLPDDASTQLILAQAATDAGDTATEKAAYTAFLRLAPSDSQAPAARQALKTLAAQAKASTTTTSG